jgi:poly(3-hydroxybutyrate) depolymerase
MMLVCAVLPATAEPIASGAGKQTADLNGTRLRVFTYRPACPDPSLLLVFHGAQRDAQDYRDFARPLADRLCTLVIAPLFDRKRFPSWRYQRGGIVNEAGRVQSPRDFTGRFVLDLVDWARKQEGRDLPYSLIAHSAGGQFLDRLVAFVPNQAVQRRTIAGERPRLDLQLAARRASGCRSQRQQDARRAAGGGGAKALTFFSRCDWAYQGYGSSAAA